MVTEKLTGPLSSLLPTLPLSKKREWVRPQMQLHLVFSSVCWQFRSDRMRVVATVSGRLLSPIQLN